MQITTLSRQNKVICSLITRARDRDTPPTEFRSILQRLGLFFGYEIANLIHHAGREVITPMESAYKGLVQDQSVFLVSAFEDADFFAAGIAQVFDDVHVGRIDAARNYSGGKWRAPVQRAEIPATVPRECAAVVAKTILASGCTATALLGEIVQITKPSHVIVTAVVSHQDACNEIASEYPSIPLHFVIGDIDPILDERGFVVPGLGSVAQRLGL